MNETTLFMAQIFGPMLGLVGLGMLLNPDAYLKATKEFTKIDASTMSINMAMIAVGVIVLVKHNMWGSLPEVLVSLIGVGFLLKGALLAAVPKVFDSMLKAILSKGLLTAGALIWVLGGLYLSWIGFLG